MLPGSGHPLHRPVYLLMQFLSAVYLVAAHRYRCHDSRRVPRRGPVLLVCNHQSLLDPPAVGVPIFHRPVHYITRASLYGFRPFAWLISMLSAIPIREDESDPAAVREIIRRLRVGCAVGIFPEGSRSPDGAVHPFKRGAAVIVARARCPVVPVAIEGAFDAWPRTSRFPRPMRPVHVAYGRPIAFDELMADGPDAALERLHAEIDTMRLSLRALIRRQTRGRWPQAGPGDHPCAEVEHGQIAARVWRPASRRRSRGVGPSAQ